MILISHAFFLTTPQTKCRQIKQKFCEEKLITVPNDAGKAAIWRNYDLVLTSNKKLCGYVQCRACKDVLAYDSKKTSTSSLQ